METDHRKLSLLSMIGKEKNVCVNNCLILNSTSLTDFQPLKGRWFLAGARRKAPKPSYVKVPHTRIIYNFGELVSWFLQYDFENSGLENSGYICQTYLVY